MKAFIRIMSFVMAIVLAAFTFAACTAKVEEPDTPQQETKKYTVTFVANEVPAFVADNIVKSVKVYDSKGNDLGFVNDVLCEGSVSYASKDGKLVTTDKMGYRSLILSTVVDAYETNEGWYIGDTLYGIGHTDFFHIGKNEAELTIRSFEVTE